MEKEFVNYSEALALKELGFDEKTLFCYFPNPNYKLGDRFDLIETAKILPNQIKNVGELIKDGSFENTILAPTFSQTFKFFREKYSLFASFHCPEYDIPTFDYRIYKIGDGEMLSGEFSTNEEAELECIKKLIEIAQKR